MKNQYDEKSFFEKYSQMDRSVKGLDGAGEWEALKKMLPDFSGKRVLDLGCGFGWHCIYAAQHGAESVIGIDLSKNMLSVAREKTVFSNVEYQLASIDEVSFPNDSFDIIISSLAFHYLKDFGDIAKKAICWLTRGGVFIFSAEHPVFTAEGSQSWHYDIDGNIMHFPVDRYYLEGERNAVFLGEQVTKYHKTMTTYLKSLLSAGFKIIDFCEPQPPAHLIETVPGMKDELRRPMMFIVSSIKE